jgi:hypothetical protein
MSDQSDAKPRKSLILNAFVEMCKSSIRKSQPNYILMNLQAAAINRRDYGDTPKTNPIASMMSITGLS